MFLWQTPRARAAFGTTEEFAAATKSLAANQGLYNGFLAAGQGHRRAGRTFPGSRGGEPAHRVGG
ncbi:DUF1304 domain-containing protein, partial [Streptomyces sp. NPDC048442]|uniref:DUF1304 domain-containing protein n=1 Tax=Streptomyces sp. NPDC048442 TaxID=3154823 RepID=UPI0034241DAF